ncbi:MAG: hypothetical protein EAZ95_10155 [Bacteroidetes bacterium]|nr:MAG: hypothetical protein EAZ95_10155 [Bacteroidota bacterium]
MKLLKLSVLVLLTVAFSVRPTKIAESTCMSMPEDWHDSYHIFTPISFSELTDFWKKPEQSEEANLNDWLAYLNNKPKLDDVRQIVYKVSANDMQAIRGYVSAGKGNLSPDLQKNSLIKYWQGNKDIEAIDYLFYAKTCEGQAGTFDDWETPKRDMSQVKWLADAGKKYYAEKASNDFLKVRFAYQAIRMAHYSNQYNKAIGWYDELVKPLEGKTNSPIVHWALAHKAGCLMSAGKEGEANFLFAQIFDKCPSKRVSSALSWKVENETVWTNALGFCKSPQDYGALHFMRSLDGGADILAEMKNVYQKTPEYDKLHVMLLREINQLENALLKVELKENLLFLNQTSPSSPAEGAKKLHKLREFVTKCVAEGKTQNKEIFAMASGYLDFMAGNGAQGIKKLEDLAKQTKNPAYQKQIEVCKLAIQVASLAKADEASETDLFNAVIKAEHKHLTEMMWNAFARLYDKQGEKGKALMCSFGSLQMSPKVEALDQLIAMTDKKKKTQMEQHLMNYLSNKNAKAYLTEIKATLLFSQDKLKEAIALYEQVPADMVGKIKENPLAFAIPHYATYPTEEGKNKYNRLLLAQKMANLKKMVENPNLDQAQQYFQLGCIYYNLTFFGNSWDAIDYYRSGTDIALAYAPNEDNFANFDCSKAKYYFDRAMNTALKDQNKELGAKAAYMAAKCEQNQYYINAKNKEVWGFIEPTYAPEHRRYFATLKKEFADTKYYKDILNECSYFNTFVKRK